MKLENDQSISFKQIAKIASEFSIKERGELRLLVEMGPTVFNQLLSEQTAQRTFHEGGMAEFTGDKLKFYCDCKCDIVRNFNLNNSEVKFRVTRYVNEYMGLEYEDLV